MSALKVRPKRSVFQLNAEQLGRIVQTAVRQALREEMTSVRVDPRGYLVFPNEKEYAAYLETQLGKLPSEVKAYFIDPHGLRVHHSDYEPTPRKARELDAARKEPTVPAEVVWKELEKLGVR